MYAAPKNESQYAASRARLLQSGWVDDPEFGLEHALSGIENL